MYVPYYHAIRALADWPIGSDWFNTPSHRRPDWRKSEEQNRESLRSPLASPFHTSQRFECMIFSTKMRHPVLIAWLLICYLCLSWVVVAQESNDNDNVRLRDSIRKDTLKGVPSCQHTFSQVELLNLVSRMSHAIFFAYFSKVKRVLHKSLR